MKVWVVTAFRAGDNCCNISDSTVVDSVYYNETLARQRESELDNDSMWDYGYVEEMEVTE